MLLVTRREGRHLRRYGHLSTGNYNPRTARLYTDISQLTAHPQLTADMDALFVHLAGQSRLPRLQRLLVAPFNLQRRMLELIAVATASAQAGKDARIVLKMNALTDEPLIRALIDAGRSGVKIDLIVRATCCLRPGVKGLSENIRLRSIVGRFLEHARIFYFENGGSPIVYCGKIGRAHV